MWSQQCNYFISFILFYVVMSQNWFLWSFNSISWYHKFASVLWYHTGNFVILQICIFFFLNFTIDCFYDVINSIMWNRKKNMIIPQNLWHHKIIEMISQNGFVISLNIIIQNRSNLVIPQNWSFLFLLYDIVV